MFKNSVKIVKAVVLGCMMMSLCTVFSFAEDSSDNTSIPQETTATQVNEVTTNVTNTTNNPNDSTSVQVLYDVSGTTDISLKDIGNKLDLISTIMLYVLAIIAALIVIIPLWKLFDLIIN